MNNIYTSLIDTPLGKMRASCKEETITGLWFEGQKYYPDTNEWIEAGENEIFKLLKIWLHEYFAGRQKAHNFLLSPSGTPFQIKVWEILRQIKYGQSMSYGDIAKLLSCNSSKMSAQAVGGAVGHNPISILIPCHRVLGANGALTGYAGGIDKKQFLLKLERMHEAER
ncbi:MAG: methylated-DNA--[protein]-cysteine S-methyltransferase [Campylobacteraceae bacterium]|jgi:methylated-DNA-[protein]-cysteine S-methyltransferase|nr:methylated-DNA--[protein]-cysteine S-methyltransferase [Campylobacteraceae bacterium]